MSCWRAAYRRWKAASRSAPRPWPSCILARWSSATLRCGRERLRRLALIESLFDPLPIDDEVARSYGRLAVAVASVGRKPRGRVMDVLIAATAHAHGARLYTRNAADLRGPEDLVEIVAV